MKHIATLVILVWTSGCTYSPPLTQSEVSNENSPALENAKVGGAAQAEGVAMQALYTITRRYDGHDARARIRSQPSFLAEADVSDFATQGDRIWPVQEIWFMETVCVVWVNAENGKVKIVKMKAESEQSPAGDFPKASPEK